MNSLINILILFVLCIELNTPSDYKVLDVSKYGDGGVDVTGVPNCRLAEGAMRRRKFITFLEKWNITCWGLQILSCLLALKLRIRDVNLVLSIKKIINFVTFPKGVRLKGEIRRNTDDNFNTIRNCFFINISLPDYFLLVNFTNLLSIRFDDFLNLVTQWKGVFVIPSPKRLVSSRCDLSQVSLAGQPTENSLDRTMILFQHPLCRVFGIQKLNFQSFTDTWQSNCACMLKSRKDTPRNFLKYARSAVIFLYTSPLVSHQWETFLSVNFTRTISQTKTSMLQS